MTINETPSARIGEDPVADLELLRQAASEAPPSPASNQLTRFFAARAANQVVQEDGAFTSTAG